MIKKFIEIIRKNLPLINCNILSHTPTSFDSISLNVGCGNITAFMEYNEHYYIINNVYDNSEFELIITNSNKNKDKYYFDFKSKNIEECFKVLKAHGI